MLPPFDRRFLPRLSSARCARTCAKRRGEHVGQHCDKNVQILRPNEPSFWPKRREICPCRRLSMLLKIAPWTPNHQSNRRNRQAASVGLASWSSRIAKSWMCAALGGVFLRRPLAKRGSGKQKCRATRPIIMADAPGPVSDHVRNGNRRNTPLQRDKRWLGYPDCGGGTGVEQASKDRGVD